MGRFDWVGNLIGRGGRGGTKADLKRTFGAISDGSTDAAGSRGATRATSETDLQNTKTAQNAQAIQESPTTEAKNLANQKNVQDAAKTKKDDLAKLGLKGAAGVAALMILTGESNPIAAVQAAVEGAQSAAETARNAASGGLNIIDQLISFFTNFGLYICICCSCIIFLIAIFMIM
jgi:hypothetical protein